MEAAISGAAAEVGRAGRRLIQRIFDPEPVNRAALTEPVWCLGRSYKPDMQPSGRPGIPGNDSHQSAVAPSQLQHHHSAGEPTPPPEFGVESAKEVGGVGLVDTPPESVPDSLDSYVVAVDEEAVDTGWPVAFLDDFESRIWMTYRSAFSVIAKSQDPRAVHALSFAMRLKTSFGEHTGFSSDTGWGCMIRSGQSLLANAISLTRLGRDWRRSARPDAEKDIIALFADDPRAPFSIHNFVQHGAETCGKYPGEWFGPSATARCIRALANSQNDSLRVYTSGDMGDVYEDSFLAVAKPDNEHFHPTLILVCTRLGTDAINQVYEEALISTLQMSQSVGIAGGRPSSSHYFVGSQGRWLFYLDPHHPRPALPYHQDPTDYTKAELDTCHTRRLRQLYVRDMDPSMLIGFLIRDEEDWHAWRSAVKHVQGKAIINVSDHDPALGMAPGRAGAIDEVEAMSDDTVDGFGDEGEDDDADTVLGP